jgi:phage tail-like protein
MTIAFASQLIQINLTPMQIPEGYPGSTNNKKDWQANSKNTDPEPHRLRVTPGECSQLLLQIKNIAPDRNLSLRASVIGDFPPEWIGNTGSDTGSDRSLSLQLEPSATKIEQINFNLTSPDLTKLFEDRTFSDVKTTPFQIDYRAQVLVYLDDEETSDNTAQLVGTVDFLIHLRPRSLYLDFVPAIYREVDFIGRFLKIFEQSFEPAVDILQTLWAYLDPNTAPSQILPFLAYWVGWPGQVPWDELKQRQLIRRAIEIYRWRGTKYGLQLYLHLYTGLAKSQIHIEESFNRSFELGKSQLGPMTLLGNGRPYHFCVRLTPPREELDRLDEPLIRTIIEQEKPAFCTYDLRFDAT